MLFSYNLDVKINKSNYLSSFSIGSSFKPKIKNKKNLNINKLILFSTFTKQLV